MTSSWADGKIFRSQQEFRRVDGTPVVSLTSTAGLLDMRERRLVANPRERFRELAGAPEVLDL